MAGSSWREKGGEGEFVRSKSRVFSTRRTLSILDKMKKQNPRALVRHPPEI